MSETNTNLLRDGEALPKLPSSRQHAEGAAISTGKLGDALDAKYEAARAKAQQAEGGRHALQAAGALMLKMHEHIDKDLADGKIDGIKEPLQIVEYAKRYVTRCSDALRNLADKAGSDILVANGKAAALREAIEVTQRHHTAAVRRAAHFEAQEREAMEAAVSGGAGGPDGEDTPDESDGPRGRHRKAGERPGSSKLEGRRKAARAAKAKPRAKAAKKTSKRTPKGKTAKATSKRSAKR